MSRSVAFNLSSAPSPRRRRRGKAFSTFQTLMLLSTMAVMILIMTWIYSSSSSLQNPLPPTFSSKLREDSNVHGLSNKVELKLGRRISEADQPFLLIPKSEKLSLEVYKHLMLVVEDVYNPDLMSYQLTKAIVEDWEKMIRKNRKLLAFFGLLSPPYEKDFAKKLIIEGSIEDLWEGIIILESLITLETRPKTITFAIRKKQKTTHNTRLTTKIEVAFLLGFVHVLENFYNFTKIELFILDPKAPQQPFSSEIMATTLNHYLSPKALKRDPLLLSTSTELIGKMVEIHLAKSDNWETASKLIVHQMQQREALVTKCFKISGISTERLTIDCEEELFTGWWVEAQNWTSFFPSLKFASYFS